MRQLNFSKLLAKKKNEIEAKEAQTMTKKISKILFNLDAILFGFDEFLRKST